MAPPLIARLHLDAQDEFVHAAGTVPEGVRDERVATLNSAAWVVAHVGGGVDETVNVNAARGAPAADWPGDLAYDDALAALHRTFDRAFAYLETLSDADLTDSVPHARTRPGMPPPTLGLMLSASVVHTFAHASELHGIAVAAGAQLVYGLPGGLDYARGKLVQPADAGRPLRIQFYDPNVASDDAVLFRRPEHVVREVSGTVVGVQDAARVLDRTIVVRRDDGAEFSTRQHAVRLALFTDGAQAPGPAS